jgi:raffinose/stachyose/melibiose transport system permease protein
LNVPAMDFFILQYYGISTCNFLDFAFATFGIFILQQILYLSPLYILFVISVKSPKEFAETLYSFPNRIEIDNYLFAIKMSKFPRLLFNSILITATSVIILITIASMAAYIMERKKTRFYKILYAFFLSGLMIPVQIIMLPLYKMVMTLNLMNTPFALILVFVGGAIPFVTFFLVGFMKTIPVELDESAMIDGASKFVTFWRIVFPLMRPAILTATIIQTLFFWNEFLLPLLFLKSYDKMTLMVGIYNFVGQRYTQWNYIFALITLAILPIIILYIICQKYIVDGIVAGALKG